MPFSIIVAYIAVFNYPTALVLIETVFGSEACDSFRPYFKGSAYVGLISMSWVCLQDLFNTVLRRTIGKFGERLGLNADNIAASRLLLKLPLIHQTCDKMKPETLMETLKFYQQTFPERLKAMNIDATTLTQNQQKLVKLSSEKTALQQQIDLIKAESKCCATSSNKNSFLPKNQRKASVSIPEDVRYQVLSYE